MTEPPCISLDSLQGHTLSSHKDITLASMHYRIQGIALLPTARTPAPNGLRSSLELLLGISPDMLVGPELSTFLALEEDDKLSP